MSFLLIEWLKKEHFLFSFYTKNEIFAENLLKSNSSDDISTHPDSHLITNMN